MNAEEFKTLSSHLIDIASKIPLRWGSIQNDNADAKINMFSCNTFSSLETLLINKPEELKNYFKKRWFLWQCAKCDEYLFYKHIDVQKNPNTRDQNWDFQFFENEELKFDLKGTIIPSKIKEKLENNDLPIPNEIIKFYFNKQSKGIRDNIQNRLFIVHIPYIKKNENSLRVNYQAKAIIYNNYIAFLKLNSNYKFFNFNTKLVDIIYLIEQSDGTITSEFASKNNIN